jgi:hypothetical protein
MGTSQLSDSDVIIRVDALRYEIHNLSIQVAPGNPARLSTDCDFQKYMLETTPETEDYLDYLGSESSSMVIESYLWRVIVGEVFQKFLWAPTLHSPLIILYNALRPGQYQER